MCARCPPQVATLLARMRMRVGFESSELRHFIIPLEGAEVGSSHGLENRSLGSSVENGSMPSPSSILITTYYREGAEVGSSHGFENRSLGSGIGNSSMLSPSSILICMCSPIGSRR